MASVPTREPTRTIALVIAAAAALVVACGPKPARKADLELESAATWECVIGLRDDGGHVMVCTELPEDCRDYRALGLKWGGAARPAITDVGPCAGLEIGIP